MKSWHQHQKIAPKAARTSRDGIVFHSKTEKDRYEYLRLLEKAKEISDLQRQPRFNLEFSCSCGSIRVMAGAKVSHYTADFSYVEKGIQVIEDVKAYATEQAKLRIRVFEAVSGKKVRIVRKWQRAWVVE